MLRFKTNKKTQKVGRNNPDLKDKCMRLLGNLIINNKHFSSYLNHNPKKQSKNFEKLKIQLNM